MIAIALSALLFGACATESTPAPVSSSAVPATSARLDPAECDTSPPTGAIDRSAHDLAFRTGEMRIAVRSTLRPTPPPGGPARPSTPASAGDRQCFAFDKWGNADPGVPPDSLLFVFKGPGSDGAQIEFLVGELTGGVLPPIGDVRPTVRPLTTPINAQVGVSVGGMYYQGSNCALTVTAMSSQRGAGSFSCAVATRVAADPFAPNDDGPFDADESSTAAAAPTSPAEQVGPPSSVGLSGWFEVAP